MDEKSFQPTPAMVKAAETLFVAMAQVDFLEPIVNGYKKSILANHQWRISEQYARRRGTEVILDPESAWLMSDEEFAVYDKLCKEARDAAELYVESPDHCPLLVARHQVSLAQNALVEAMGMTTVDDLLCSGMERYKKYVDLSLRLLAPFVRPTSEIMADVIGHQFVPTECVARP